jgi:hypothetical protein
MNNNNPGLSVLNMIYVLMAWLFIAPVLSSCSSNSNVVNPSSTTTRLLVVNASPDAGPLTAFVNNIQLGNSGNVLALRTYFRYAAIPSYYGIGNGYITMQLRTDHNIGLTTDTATIVVNKSYSLFLVGLNSIDSLSTIFTADTSKLPPLGSGKIRFINASPRTPALSLSANGTSAFANIAFKQVSPYIQIPVGTYDFKVTATGAPTNVLTDLPLTTVQDGRLYTLYTRGLVGRTDTAALNLSVITNQ